MNDSQEIKKQVIESFASVYEQYFGETTARIYKQFYNDKDLKVILISAKELLHESAGFAKGEEIFNKIYTQYNLTIEI